MANGLITVRDAADAEEQGEVRDVGVVAVAAVAVAADEERLITRQLRLL